MTAGSGLWATDMKASAGDVPAHSEERSAFRAFVFFVIER
jgi:hypothetical protein